MEYLVIVALLVSSGVLFYKYIKVTKYLPALIKKERDKAVNLSRNVVKGQIAEQMFPLLTQALGQYNAGDMTFIGKLFDYVIIDGYGEAKDNNGDIKEVIFLDVKTGNAQLSAHQLKLKNAIDAGKVSWCTIRIDNGGVIHMEK